MDLASRSPRLVAAALAGGLFAMRAPARAQTLDGASAPAASAAPAAIVADPPPMASRAPSLPPPLPSSEPTAPPRSITLHHDGHGAPVAEPITRFGVTGEPLAYTDWLCVDVAHDAGPSIEIALDDITVRDDTGRPLGTFTSASGRLHRFVAFRLGSVPQYCTRILPREHLSGSVRFTPDANAPWRIARVVLGWRGDSAGCESATGRRSCSELRPALASFTYGFTAMSYAHLDVGRWQGSTIDFSRGLVDPMARFRITGFLPLWLTAIGPANGFQSSLEAGLALPVTFASEGQFGNGTTPRSVVGFGLGLYWAQCFAYRAPVTPRVCAGVDVEAVVDGVVQAGVVTATEPRFLATWFVSIGAGAH